MTLPMAEGPRDGDFARYVEQLAQGAAPLPAPPAQAPANRAHDGLPVKASTSRAVGRPVQTADKRILVLAGSPVTRLKVQVVVAAVAVGLTALFVPRLLTPLLVFVGFWLLSAIIRWAVAAAKHSS